MVPEPIHLTIFRSPARGNAMTPKEFQKSNLAAELKAEKKRLENALRGLSDEQSERTGGNAIRFGRRSSFRDRDEGVFGVDGSL
jgi:hypothetical protein